MSYIGYDIDAMNAVPAIATACETTPAAIGWGLPQMWLHCLRSKDDIVTDRHLLGFFGRARDLGQTLETFGFLEAVEGGWRVRGADARLRINQLRSEAGKKGREKQLAGQTPGKRRASAGQVPSKSRANAGQTDEPSSDGPVSEMGHEDGYSSGSRAHARQMPSTSPASAEQVPSSGPGLPSTSPGKTAENAILPGQKRALTPSTISLSSSSPEREGFAHTHAPARMSAHARDSSLDWPGPFSQPASTRFHDALCAHGPVGGPPPAITPASYAELAREYGDAAFSAGCQDAVESGPSWPGWRVRNPLNWLRTACETARHRLANPPRKQSREKPRPPTYADLEEGAQLSDAPLPRAPGRPPTYADLEAERGGVA